LISDPDNKKGKKGFGRRSLDRGMNSEALLLAAAARDEDVRSAHSIFASTGRERVVDPTDAV
jgi:hypothetical protein